MNTKTLTQALLTGVVTVLLGLILVTLFGAVKPEVSGRSDAWTKFYVLEVMLFFVGVSLRYLLVTQMGKQYLLTPYCGAKTSSESEGESEQVSESH